MPRNSFENMNTTQYFTYLHLGMKSFIRLFEQRTLNRWLLSCQGQGKVLEDIAKGEITFFIKMDRHWARCPHAQRPRRHQQRRVGKMRHLTPVFARYSISKNFYSPSTNVSE